MLLLCFDGIKQYCIEYKFSILEYVNIKCITFPYCDALNTLTVYLTGRSTSIFIVAPCFLKSIYFTHQQMHYLLNLQKFKIYIKIHTNIAPTCFGLRPSSGSLYWTWLKLYFCKNIRWNYVVICYLVMWHDAILPNNI